MALFQPHSTLKTQCLTNMRTNGKARSECFLYLKQIPLTIPEHLIG